jgi:hypothetical protein
MRHNTSMRLPVNRAPLCRTSCAALASFILLAHSSADAADPVIGTCSAGQRATSEASSADKSKRGKKKAPDGTWFKPGLAGGTAPDPTGGCIAEPAKSSKDKGGANTPGPQGIGPGGYGLGYPGKRRPPLHAPDYAYSPYPYAQEGSSRTWRLDATAEGAYAFNDTARTNVGVRIFSGALELSASANLFVAPYGTGATVFGTRVETAWLGDVGGSLASPTADGVHFHYGGGALYWNNEGQGATGGYGSYGIDFFPLDPIIISTVAKVGGLGGQWYFDIRGTAGVSLGQIEAYVGYSHLRVGGVSLGGPLMGIRMWL